MKLIILIWLVLTLIGPVWLYATGRVDLDSDYATANRESAHLAPDPKRTPEAVIQVYSARAFSWRGIVAKLIPEIENAARNYPYASPYVLWPGPNSNTFPAYIARAIPALRLALPSDAVGKDFLPNGALFANAPSGTGYQFSLYGVLGILAAKDEGFEINILGLTYGIKFSPLKVLLPGFGYGVNLAKRG